MLKVSVLIFLSLVLCSHVYSQTEPNGSAKKENQPSSDLMRTKIKSVNFAVSYSGFVTYNNLGKIF